MNKYLLLSICPVFLLLLGCNHFCNKGTLHQNVKEENRDSSLKQRSCYVFEGTEPFWKMEIHNDSLFLFCSNKEVRMKVFFAEKSVNGNTIGFSNELIHGVINENWEHNCCYAITEKDSLPYEIFFVFGGKTYKGCGEMVKKME